MSFDPQEFQDYFALWQLENHSPNWVLFRSPEAAGLVRERAASFGGYISISHFSRAFDELRAEGKISQIRQPRPAEIEEESLTPEQFKSLPSAVVQQRFKNDPEFRADVESLIAQGKI